MNASMSRRILSRDGKRRHSGFTLIELLVSVTIMSSMAAVLLAAVGNVRERARSQHCRNNLRELGAAFSQYDTFFMGKLPPTTAPGDDNLRALYPLCVKSFDLFICVSTGNEIRTPDDLSDNAFGGRAAGRGHSYEYLSHYLFDRQGRALETPLKKTRSGIDVRADKTWLLMDAVEAGTPNVPDLFDNHFEAGANVLFGDSHVEWVPSGKWEVAFKSGNSR